MNQITTFIFDRLLYPKECVGCTKIGNYFCSGCVSKILQTDLVCPECERPAIGGKTHPLCKKRLGMDGLWSLGIYTDPLKKAVQKLKYRFVRELAEELINITIEYWALNQPLLLNELKKDGGANWTLVPVPLHPKRENWRGFNQSALLGKMLAEKLGLNYADSLKRIKETQPQARLLSHARQNNIRGAFAPAPNCSPISPNIILLDDVWTTGSTPKECTKILKRAGAGKVWGLTLAR